MPRLPALTCALLLSGCAVVENTSAERFSATGELVALSGADAGAANACFTCHGIDGAGDGIGAPRLSGLDAGYLERQLIAYADGRRQHPQMAWIAGRLDPDERTAVAEYYALLPADIEPAPPPPRLALFHAGDPARGLPACAECHGANGDGIGPANPPLAGQPAAYLAQQMDLWRSGKRRNDPGEVMLRISQLLTPSEILALAGYAAGLSPDDPSPERRAAFPAAHRGDPRSGVSALPLHVPESARTAR
jgi:cytochrome c553